MDGETGTLGLSDPDMGYQQICPMCTSPEVNFWAYDDGGGDHGDEITERWECQDCGYHFDKEEMY